MCTAIRFSDNKGNMYFGRNLDWSVGYGQRIVITGKGYNLESAFCGKITSAHAIIGMGIIEEDVPLYFDCGNDAGLAIAGLNFPGYAEYEKDKLPGKTSIAAYEFPLWVAMNFANVDEAEAALREVAIVAKPINDNYPVSMLHWIIGDARRSIVVEYTAKGMEIYKDEVDVLTNQPGFDWHRENLRNYMNAANDMPESAEWGETSIKPFGAGAMMRGIPGDCYSTSRFVRVAYLNAHYPKKETEEENVSRMFHTLSGVAFVEGTARMRDGQYEKTIYTGGFSSGTNTYYYNTYEDFSIRSVCLNDYMEEAKGKAILK